MSAPGPLAARLRPWSRSDAPALVTHANSLAVWRNVRDRFPHPYTPADAESWLALALAEPVPVSFAVELDGEAVGGFGLIPGSDVERVGAEIGYWLGETVWGRGLATAGARALTGHAIFTLGFERVFAQVFHPNAASIRVLEKAGFRHEGRLRRSAIKDGVVLDQVLLAAVRGEWEPGGDALLLVPAR